MQDINFISLFHVYYANLNCFRHESYERERQISDFYLGYSMVQFVYFKTLHVYEKRIG